ncbi:MAG: glycoside hydrolase family 2 [Bacteroidales bacterium]|nr:glycoside hydrolase family 2 [Bacteroidales bacterium]
MNRFSRSILTCLLLSLTICGPLPSHAQQSEPSSTVSALYELFQNPPTQYRPWVRWWWNGNKVNADELVRELHLLKEAGIGGVEINPIEFPTHGDDSMGIASLPWLSDEWLSALRTTLDSARAMGMGCDLLVGSGWPIGGTFVPEKERAQILCPYALEIEGPQVFTIFDTTIFRSADPKITSPNPARQFSIFSLQLIPTPCTDLSQGVDVSAQHDGNGRYAITIPEGKFILSAIVQIRDFMRVIDGAPGANGPVVDHFNRAAVDRYLNRMGDALTTALPDALRVYLRAMFMDSMELEGANWSDHFREEFQRRRGYDIVPYLNYILWPTRGMGDPVSYQPLVPVCDSLRDQLQRVRYDFELTKAELLRENFTIPYTEWCRRLGLQSRAQAYGRGFFPLESSQLIDMPECESWTTNYLHHRPGFEMPEYDYRRGRAYTMINKYVSSAAHLEDRHIVSCEEMTNTYHVFNMDLKELKIGGDMSICSGVTQSIYHGFNYMPPNAPFPGWIRYGAYYNERNNWWPYFKAYNDYKARVYAVLQNCTHYADIAILNPDGDMWSQIGMQNEPFPNQQFAQWRPLVWEAIMKNGGSSDYISEEIIRNATIQDGQLCYKQQRYGTIFLLGVRSLSAESVQQLERFVESGGTLFCIDSVPDKALGLLGNDSLVQGCIERMAANHPQHFHMVDKPDNNYLSWYRELQQEYHLPHALTIANPDPYLMQIHYKTNDGEDIFFVCNSDAVDQKAPGLSLTDTIYGKSLSCWDPLHGTYHPKPSFFIKSATSYLYVTTPLAIPETAAIPEIDMLCKNISHDWKVTLTHAQLGTIEQLRLDSLVDMATLRPNFSGTITYVKDFHAKRGKDYSLGISYIEGTAVILLNGNVVDTLLCGERLLLFDEFFTPIPLPKKFMHKGKNTIEIRVITTMGNYVRSLTDNPVAQYWTNKGSKAQPLKPMGMMGSVYLHRLK